MRRLAEPTTRRLDDTSLCRDLANSLCLEVVFAPRMVASERPSKYPSSRVPRRKSWEVSPVWKTAPTTAYQKAKRLSSLLRLLVAFGWRVPVKPLVRKLQRLSINIWRMSLGDFTGLCRSISSSVLDQIRNQKDPEPLLRFATLSNLPYFNVEKFLHRAARSKERIKALFGCNNRPKQLGLAVLLRNLCERSPRKGVRVV